MPRPSELRVLVARDGSSDAQAAVTTVLHFPWPDRTRVRVVSARRTRAEYRRSILLAALDRAAEIATEDARRTLEKRWPDVETAVVDKTRPQSKGSSVRPSASGLTSSSSAGEGLAPYAGS